MDTVLAQTSTVWIVAMSTRIVRMSLTRRLFAISLVTTTKAAPVLRKLEFMVNVI